MRFSWARFESNTARRPPMFTRDLKVNVIACSISAMWALLSSQMGRSWPLSRTGASQVACCASEPIGRARPVLSAKFRVVCEEATADVWPGPTFAPSEFVLMESQLGAEGSNYSVVTRFAIAG